MESRSELLTLRDGTQLERSRVHTVMQQIFRLSKNDVETFYRFLGLAALPDWQLQPNQLLRKQLEGTVLLEDGKVPESVRHVLQSSLEGKYPDFRLTWPVKD